VSSCTTVERMSAFSGWVMGTWVKDVFVEHPDTGPSWPTYDNRFSSTQPLRGRLRSARYARLRSTSPAGIGWQQPESNLQKGSYTGPDFLESVQQAFPRINWDKAYNEFKAAGESPTVEGTAK